MNEYNTGKKDRKCMKQNKRQRKMNKNVYVKFSLVTAPDSCLNYSVHACIFIMIIFHIDVFIII